jgi:Mn-containing catalase
VRKYFNDSTGVGQDGAEDARGPWNQADDIEYVEAPARLEAQVTQQQVEREINRAAGR